MVVTQTPRVKYNLDAGGTIGVQHENWDRADELAGLWYTDSVTGEPPVEKRYDGMVCVEKDTGISYRYLWNGSSFDKKFVNYPMHLRAYEQIAAQGNGTPGLKGWNTWDESRNINAKIADWKDTPTNGVRIKVKALYSLKIHIRWVITTVPTTGASDRDLGFGVNGVVATADTYNRLVNTGWAYEGIDNSIAVRKVFNVGDLIQAYFFNNGGGVQNVTYTVELSIIRPVW
jgi:hypothetical protein